MSYEVSKDAMAERAGVAGTAAGQLMSVALAVQAIYDRLIQLLPYSEWITKVVAEGRLEEESEKLDVTLMNGWRLRVIALGDLPMLEVSPAFLPDRANRATLVQAVLAGLREARARNLVSQAPNVPEDVLWVSLVD